MRNPTASRTVSTSVYLRKALSLFVFVALCVSGTVESASKIRGRALGIGYGSTDAPVLRPDVICSSDNEPTATSPELAESISNDETDAPVASTALTADRMDTGEESILTAKLTKSEKQPKSPVSRRLSNRKERKLEQESSPCNKNEDMVTGISKATKGSKKSKSTKKKNKKLTGEDMNGSDDDDVDGRIDDGSIDSESTEEPTVHVTTFDSSSSPSIANFSNPTFSPTTEPSGLPTRSPTVAPSAVSTESPTVAPTLAPTAGPTEAPSDVPSEYPTNDPSDSPTLLPLRGVIPTTPPSAAPSKLLKTAKSLELVETQKLHVNQKQTKAPIVE